MHIRSTDNGGHHFFLAYHHAVCPTERQHPKCIHCFIHTYTETLAVLRRQHQTLKTSIAVNVASEQ